MPVLNWMVKIETLEIFVLLGWYAAQIGTY